MSGNLHGAMVFLGGVCDGAVKWTSYDDAALYWLRDALDCAPYWSDEARAFWGRYDDGAADVLRGKLVDMDLLDYGTSPRGAWLTDTGKRLLASLRSMPDGFAPHDEWYGCSSDEGCPNCAALAVFLSSLITNHGAAAPRPLPGQGE